MASMYIHVPYCHAKCVYCDFLSITDLTNAGSFRKGIQMEQELLARDLDPLGVTFTSLYLGGGTPTALDISDLVGIVEETRSRFSFVPDAEFVVECNPGTVTRDTFLALRDAGVNRLSLGVQSFDDVDLVALSRIHTAHQARSAIEDARSAGLNNLNIDLIFSLPGQTPERWRSNLEIASRMDLPHLSCYSLTVEPSTPLHRLVRTGRVHLPDAETDAELFVLTMEFLREEGYEHYEVSNYARPGFRSQHNEGYWRQEDYLGLGPSAFSTWKNRRWRNPLSVAEWQDSLKDGTRPERDLEELTQEHRAEEAIFLGLRSGGLDLDGFHSRHGVDLRKEKGWILDQAKKDGLIRISEGRLTLTDQGFLLCDELCARLV